MTRKRFVKLLMSYGYSRDEAKAEALEVQLSMRPWSYEKQYTYMKNRGILLGRKCGAKLQTTFKQVKRSIHILARGIRSMLREWVQKFENI